MLKDEISQDSIIEINLIDIILSIFCHWRSLLIAMIIGAVVLAGYSAINEYRHMTDEAYIKELQETYETDLEAYEIQKEQLEKKINNLEEDYTRQQFYEKNAVMLQFDHYDVYIRTVSFYVNTGYEIAPELYYQNPNYTGVITNSYKAAVDRIDLDAVIATKDNPDLTVQNPINGSKKMLYTSVDSGNGVLNITVYGDTQERADLIVNAIKAVLSEQEVLLNKIIGEHTIDILSEESYSDVDLDFLSLKRSFDDKTEAITSGINEATKELETLKEPVNKVPSLTTVVKQGIKFGIIGALIGLILVGAFFLLQLLLQDKINSVEDIRRRYSAPVLGTYLCNDTKQTKIDMFLASKLGISTEKTKEEQIQFIVSNLQIYLRETEKILLIGNCETDTLHVIGEQISSLMPLKKVSIGGNVNVDSKAIDALAEKAAVICVERWRRTPHREIRHELMTVGASGNKNLGYIVLA